MKKIKIIILLLSTTLLLNSCSVWCPVFGCKGAVICQVINGAEKVKQVYESMVKSRGAIAVTTQTNVSFENISFEEKIFFDNIDDVSFIDLNVPNPNNDNEKKSFFKNLLDKVKKELCAVNEVTEYCTETRCVLNQNGESLTIIEIVDGKMKTTNLTGKFNDAQIKMIAEKDKLYNIRDFLAAN